MTRPFSFRLLSAFAALPIYVLPGQTTHPHPYVVLVSLDGFRSGYAEKYHATHLPAIGKAGAAAEGMIPSFRAVRRTPPVSSSLKDRTPTRERNERE
jgi:hypothetical protein